MNANKKNIISGAAGIAFSLIFFALSFQIKVTSLQGNTQLDSRLFPQIWAVALFLTAMYLMGKGLFGYFRAKQHGAAHGKGAAAIDFKKDVVPALSTFILLFLYVFLLQDIGFIIMSLLYVYLQILILTPKQKRNYWKPAVISVISVAIIYFIFTILFKMVLPRGIFALI